MMLLVSICSARSWWNHTIQKILASIYTTGSQSKRLKMLSCTGSSSNGFFILLFLCSSNSSDVSFSCFFHFLHLLVIHIILHGKTTTDVLNARLNNKWESIEQPSKQTSFLNWIHVYYQEYNQRKKNSILDLFHQVIINDDLDTAILFSYIK